MRVLVLTVNEMPPKRMRKLVERLDLGPDLDLELLTVRPPGQRLDVARVDSVDPSLVPFRPVVPVSGPGTQDWSSARKAVARVLRAGRRVVTKAPVPGSWRVADRRFLEIACATSPELKRRLDEIDVVVALERASTRAAWLLGRRNDRPVVVWGATNVRKALERYGRPVPESVPTAASGAGDSLAGTVGEIEVADLPVRLLIAPANYAGQGFAWAESVRRHCPDATAVSMRAGRVKDPFPIDYEVDRDTFTGDLAWRLAWRERVMSDFTHVIVEANRPVLGNIMGEGDQHVAELQRAGKRVAYLTHGSDARIPSVHAARERWHSYDALPPSELEHLEYRARWNVEVYNSFDGPVFVSTPGLLSFVPAGVWLPVVVRVDDWQSDVVPLERERPVVAHIPSSAQKGSHLIDPILQRLHDAGLIEYLRAEGIPHEQMPDFYRRADIMVEQFGIADYSVAACEAMAAGRVVVSRVADAVRQHVSDQTGLELPIVEANPETLEKVIAELIANPEEARATAKRGVEFVRAVHDGRRSARVLGAWLSREDDTADHA